MALTINTQLSIQGALVGGLLSTPSSSGGGLASAIRSQFYQSQASLILNRVSSETRTLTYQQTLNNAVNLERSTFPLLSRPGHDPVFAPRDFYSSDETQVRGYSRLWARPTSFEIDVLSVSGASTGTAGQTVVSNIVAGDDSWNGPEGVQDFRLTIDGQDYDMSVISGSGLTYRQVLDAIAAEVNAQTDIGVVATTRQIETGGKHHAYLELTSDESRSQAFTLSDLSGDTLLSFLRLRTDLQADPNNELGGVLHEAGVPEDQLYSSFLDKDQKLYFTTGINTFDLVVGSATYHLSIDVPADKDNEDILKRIKDAINAAAGSAVTAEVYTKWDSAQLKVSVDNPADTLQLLDTSGDAILKAGMERVAGGSGVRYRIDNGPIQYAASSRVELNGTVLWLLQETTSPVTITVTPRIDDISDSIQSLIGAWNEQFDHTTANSGELTTPIASSMNLSVGSLPHALHQIGIDRGANGLFTVDVDVLEQALSSNLEQVRSLISGAAGLATTARRISRDFLTAPSKYVTNPQNPVAAYALRLTDYYETRGLLLNTIG